MIAFDHKALVVDDEGTVRQLAMRALTRQGFQCQPAQDGGVARELLESCQFDVVITDLRMPNEHGYGLVIDLLSQPARPLVVVLTGVAEPRLAADLMQRGVDDIMFKPIDFDLFANKVRTLVERHKYSRHDGPREVVIQVVEASNAAEATADVGEDEAWAEARIEAAHDDAQLPESPREDQPAPTADAEAGATADDPLLEPSAAGEQEPVVDSGSPGPESTEALAAEASLSPKGPVVVRETERVVQQRVTYVDTLATILGGSISISLAIVFLSLTSIWLAMQIYLVYQQARAVSALERLGAQITRNERNVMQIRLDDAQLPHGLAHLSEMRDVRDLHLGGTHVRDEDLARLAALGSLERLNLGGTSVSDVGLEWLERLTRLRELDLERSRITDQGMHSIETLRSLEELNLRDTDVTDAGLERLRSLDRLRRLDLRGSRVTSHGADDLRRARPDLEVKLLEGPPKSK